jgi:hypothetical protein
MNKIRKIKKGLRDYLDPGNPETVRVIDKNSEHFGKIGVVKWIASGPGNTNVRYEVTFEDNKKEMFSSKQLESYGNNKNRSEEISEWFK